MLLNAHSFYSVDEFFTCTDDMYCWLYDCVNVSYAVTFLLFVCLWHVPHPIVLWLLRIYGMYVFFYYYLFAAWPITTVMLHAFRLIYNTIYIYTVLERCAGLVGVCLFNLGYRMGFGSWMSWVLCNAYLWGCICLLAICLFLTLNTSGNRVVPLGVCTRITYGRCVGRPHRRGKWVNQLF
jgi:hypothetical protein